MQTNVSNIIYNSCNLSFSCHYGERCKYLHELQQQQKSNGPGFGVQNSSHRNQTSNPFGFGSHAGTQQHNTNPFGFGLQNSSQSTRGAGSESKQNQFKVLYLPIYVANDERSNFWTTLI